MVDNYIITIVKEGINIEEGVVELSRANITIVVLVKVSIIIRDILGFVG